MCQTNNATAKINAVLTQAQERERLEALAAMLKAEWIRCSCNRISEAGYARAIMRNADAIAAAPSLKKAAGIVFRAAREEAGGASGGCGSCVIRFIPGMLQKLGYFKDEPAGEKPEAGCGGGGNCSKCKLVPLSL